MQEEEAYAEYLEQRARAQEDEQEHLEAEAAAAAAEATWQTKEDELKKEIMNLFKWLNKNWKLLEKAETDLNDILNRYDIKQKPGRD